MMKLFKKLFPKAVELQAAKQRIEYLEANNAEHASDNDSLWKDLNSLAGEKQKLSKELNELKAKLREQNDADLMLVSERIIRAIVQGEKPQPSDINAQQRLMAQRQAYGIVHTSGLAALSGYATFGNLGMW